MATDAETGEEIEEAEDWLTTYADAITLLMAFFVMLLNFSKIDIPKFEEAAAGIAKEMSMKSASPTQSMKLDIQDVVYSMQAEQAAAATTDDEGIVIELASSAFYKPGSAEIRDEAAPVLQKIIQTLIAPRYFTYMIEIEGHTDDDPISTPRYPSNWELSAGRATRAARFFVAEGMDQTRLKASGFAATRPKKPNRNADGTPNRENQGVNRRVNIRVFPMTIEQRLNRQRAVSIEELNAQQQAAPVVTVTPVTKPDSGQKKPPEKK